MRVKGRFTYLHLAANRVLTEAFMAARVTGIAYETVEVNRRLPLLEPMSEKVANFWRRGWSNFGDNEAGGEGWKLVPSAESLCFAEACG